MNAPAAFGVCESASGGRSLPRGLAGALGGAGYTRGDDTSLLQSDCFGWLLCGYILRVFACAGGEG